MTVLEMYYTCHSCPWYKSLCYADGHTSIACHHPSVDPKTTRDITLMDRCPEDKHNPGNVN